MERESVWDYPRPPKLERSARRVVVAFAGATVADSARAHRVLETSHPPVYYVTREDVDASLVEPVEHVTWCEWKGRAAYVDVVVGERRATHAGWSYPSPAAAFEPIRDAIAFYPQRVECTLDGEPVHAQEGGFYGGWVTGEIDGPFKGAPGTSGW